MSQLAHVHQIHSSPGSTAAPGKVLRCKLGGERVVTWRSQPATPLRTTPHHAQRTSLIIILNQALYVGLSGLQSYY